MKYQPLGICSFEAQDAACSESSPPYSEQVIPKSMSQLLQYYKSNFQGTAGAPSSSRAPSLTQPTFEDLSIDDSLTELQRLVRYVKSSIGLQRYGGETMSPSVRQCV